MGKAFFFSKIGGKERFFVLHFSEFVKSVKENAGLKTELSENDILKCSLYSSKIFAVGI